MTSELIGYVVRYGGFCRDCADNDGTCPLSGMPCDPKQQTAVIKHTIEALKYGIEHGFIESPFAVKVPDVPELVRYGFELKRYATDGFHEKTYFVKKPDGQYVFHSQAVEVITAIGVWKLNSKTWEDNYNSALKRAEAAEAKLAQIEKQEPFGYIIDGAKVYENPRIHQMSVRGASTPVYLAPVASDADLRANVLVKAVTKMIEDDKRFEGEIPLATIKKVYAAHAAIIAALNPSEPRT